MTVMLFSRFEYDLSHRESPWRTFLYAAVRGAEGFRCGDVELGARSAFTNCVQNCRLMERKRL